MNYQSLSSVLHTSTQKYIPLKAIKNSYGNQISAKRKIISRIGILMLLLPLLFSCASINVVNMVPDAAEYGTQHPGTVSLSVESGQKAGVGMYSGTIKPSEFKQAILKSLEKVKLFKGIANKKEAAYLIKVKLIYAGSHPGFNMHAWVNAEWSLVDINSKKMIWSKLVKGKGHATVGEAFVGAKRQLMAIERGAKANIDEAFAEIGKLDL